MQIGLLNAVRNQAQINMTGYYDYNKTRMQKQTQPAHNDLSKKEEKALKKYNKAVSKAQADMSKALLKINKKKDKLKISEDFTKKALKKFKKVDAFEDISVRGTFDKDGRCLECKPSISRFFEKTIGDYGKKEVKRTPEGIDKITALIIKRTLKSRLADVAYGSGICTRQNESLGGEGDYSYSVCYQGETAIPESIYIQNPLDCIGISISMDKTGLEWKQAKIHSPYYENPVIIDNPHCHKSIRR